MGIKADATFLFLFVAFNIALAFLNDVYLLSGLLILLLFLISSKGKFLGYIRLFCPLYIFSFAIVLSNAFFYKNNSSVNFSADGAICGAIIALRVIVASSGGYVYRMFTSYYRLANIFQSASILKRFLKVLSVIIILIFMFCQEIKRAAGEYRDAFLQRCGSISIHLFKYILGLSRHIISSSLLFASSTADSLSCRNII